MRLGGQPLAALCATSGENLLPAFGGFARAKAVVALALQAARLIGPFHRSVLKTGGIAVRAAKFTVKQEAGA